MSSNIFEGLQSPFPSAPASSDEAPPPYSTLPDGGAGAGAWAFGSPQPPLAAGFSPVGMKLGYMDFVPMLLKKRLMGKNEYDTFSSLLQRANTWLEDHQDLHLVACETVKFYGPSLREIYSDSMTYRRFGTHTCVTALRFWYMSRVVPSPGHVIRRCQVIGCQTLVARTNETFTQLLARLNDSIAKLSGRVLSVETVRVYVDGETADSEACVWREDTSSAKRVVLALRVYMQLVGAGDPCRQTIGYQDFVPSRTNRSKENKGYELHSDVMDRAARWIARQQGVRFTGVQTIKLKIKKVTDNSFSERCSYTDHGSNRAVNLLTIIRAYFVIEQPASAPRVEFPSTRLTYRTFAPAQLGVATAAAPPKYEDMRTVLERINQWIQMTGATLFSMETMSMKQTLGIQQALGPEATFTTGQDVGNPPGKHLIYVRIYLNGDYIEPPNALALANPHLVTYTN